MTDVLFVHSQTLYAKVTIPVALALIDKGIDVSFEVNRPVLFGRSFGFSDDAIKQGPTGVGILNPEAYDFVADLIGLGAEWRKVRHKVRYTLIGERRARAYDAIVGTTKNIAALHRLAAKNVPTFALGYQHLPVVAHVRPAGTPGERQLDRRSVFFSDNAFADQHDFKGIVAGCDTMLNAFTFLDAVHARRPAPPANGSAGNKLLIFHPGGYRSVISEPGDDRAHCLARQKSFMERLCLPAIAEGLAPIIKVHPLRARHHDIEDLAPLARDIERENGLADGAIELIGPRGWFWDAAFASALILGFGSSSTYELWSAGLRNVYVGNFEGTARSSKFDFFQSIFLDTYEDYLRILRRPDSQTPDFDALSEAAFTGYNDLFNGQAVASAVDAIETLISS